MSLLRPFTEHPESVGETYTEHCAVAAGFGLRLVAAGCACFIHGLLPFLFTSTGSRAVARLHERMVVQRRCDARVRMMRG